VYLALAHQETSGFAIALRTKRKYKFSKHGLLGFLVVAIIAYVYAQWVEFLTDSSPFPASLTP
jgi:hypothetical protein